MPLGAWKGPKTAKLCLEMSKICEMSKRCQITKEVICQKGESWTMFEFFDI